MDSLPEGLDTDIGEKGACLSGGEKQRLALSRLWFDASELIILDEATSNLDPSTEAHVMKNVIQKLESKTVIAIAHRLRSIADFDKIVLFQGGKIIGQGRFDDLMQCSPYFRELYHESTCE